MTRSGFYLQGALHILCFCILTTLGSLGVTLVAEAAAPPYSVSIQADRSDAIYRVGELVTFNIKVLQNLKPIDGLNLQWRLSLDGDVTLREGTVAVKNGEAQVTGTLDAPGFLQLQTTLQAGGATIETLAGAAVDPLTISAGQPVPEDFDAFWAAKKALLAAVPQNPRLTKVNSGRANIDAFDVRVDSLGAPVSGYLARPAGAKPKSLPAIITLHGAGVRSASIPTSWAEEGMLALDINAHGIPNGMSSSYYSTLSSRIATEVPVRNLTDVIDYMQYITRPENTNGSLDWIKAGPLGDYRISGAESKDTYYYLGVFLRLVRAIDFLTSQPEWDGHTVILYGSSQGGAQALAGAGLDPRVTFFVAAKPSMADFNGVVHSRLSRWLNTPLADPSLSPSDWAKKLDNIKNTVRYFDTANLITRTKADGFFVVGFVDTTVAPTSVYAVYNNVKTKKSIYNDVTASHTNSATSSRLMKEAVLAHIAKKSEPETTAKVAESPAVWAGYGGKLTGKLAVGTGEDIIIRNNKLSMIIAAKYQHSQLPNATLGKPLDMAVNGCTDGLDWINFFLTKEKPIWTNSGLSRTVQYQSVRVTSVTNDEAVVEADGIYNEVSGVTVHTKYTLHPDEDWVYALSTVRNPGDQDLTLWVGESMDNDDGKQYIYVPGVGEFGPGTENRGEYVPTENWAGHWGDAEQGYAIVYEDSFAGFHSLNANTTLMTMRQITIPAKGQYDIGRYIVAVSSTGRAHKMDAVVDIYKMLQARE